jgi:hypothetical protein
MRWTWQDFEALPLTVYDVLVEQMRDEQNERSPGGRLWQS